MRWTNDTSAHRRRPSACWWVVAVAVCASVLAGPDVASAHVPQIADTDRSDAVGTAPHPFPDAQPLASPSVSRAVYGYLAPGRDFDSYRFTVDAPVTTTVALLVPVRSDYEGFQPRLSICEQGWHESREIPSGSGRAEYEPFSAVSLREVRAGEIELTPGRTYYLCVRPGTGGSNGPYVIVFSGAERFSAREIASTLVMLPVIWSGGWAGAPVRPAAYGCCGAVLLVGLAAAALVAWRRRGAADANAMGP